MGPPSWPLLLGWAAGADLATMAPVYCPPHAARTRGRELCPTDPICAASVKRFAAAPRRAPPRVAVLLRGVAFRNWGSRDTEGSCCRGTEASQRSVVESWNEHLFAPLEARGYEVNIYVATYRCSNGKDWVERDLLAQLAPRLRGVYLGSYDNTTQSATHARALELAHAESSSREDQPEGAGDQPEGAGDQPAGASDAARAFEHVFIMRLDMALTRSTVWKSKFYGAFLLNRRVVLRAIDATPARWRGDAGSSPLDRARTAASSPRHDLAPDTLIDSHTGGRI
jgi:hypothetical protein